MRIGFPCQLPGNHLGSWVELRPFRKAGEVKLNCPTSALERTGIPSEVLADNLSLADTALKNYQKAVKYFNSRCIAIESLEYLLPQEPGAALDDAWRFCSRGNSSKLATLLALAQQGKSSNSDAPLILISADFKIHNSNIIIKSLDDTASLVKKWLQTKESGARALILHKNDAAALAREWYKRTGEHLERVPIGQWQADSGTNCLVVTVGPNSILQLADRLDLPKEYFAPLHTRHLWRIALGTLVLLLGLLAGGIFSYKRYEICSPFRWDCVLYGHPVFSANEPGIIIDETTAHKYGGPNILPGNAFRRYLPKLKDELESRVKNYYDIDDAVVIVNQKEAIEESVGGTGIVIKNGYEANNSETNALQFNHLDLSWTPRKIFSGQKTPTCPARRYRKVIQLKGAYNNNFGIPTIRIWLPAHALLLNGSPPLFKESISNYRDEYPIFGTKVSNPIDNTMHDIEIPPAYFPYGSILQIFPVRYVWMTSHSDVTITMAGLLSTLKTNEKLINITTGYIRALQKDQDARNECAPIIKAQRITETDVDEWVKLLSSTRHSSLESEMSCLLLQLIYENYLINDVEFITRNQAPCDGFNSGSLSCDYERRVKVLEAIEKAVSATTGELAYCVRLAEWLTDLNTISAPAYRDVFMNNLMSYAGGYRDEEKVSCHSSKGDEEKELDKPNVESDANRTNIERGAAYTFTRIKSLGIGQYIIGDHYKGLYDYYLKQYPQYDFCIKAERAKQILLYSRDPLETSSSNISARPGYISESDIQTAVMLTDSALRGKPYNLFLQQLNAVANFRLGKYPEAAAKFEGILNVYRAKKGDFIDDKYVSLAPCDPVDIEINLGIALYYYTVSELFACQLIQLDQFRDLVNNLPGEKSAFAQYIEQAIYLQASSPAVYLPDYYGYPALIDVKAYGEYMPRLTCMDTVKINIDMLITVKNELSN